MFSPFHLSLFQSCCVFSLPGDLLIQRKKWRPLSRKMTKSSKDENFVQTFDFAGKTITLEDAEPLSDDEQDNFIEFKASEKIPEIHVEGDEDGPARYVGVSEKWKF